MSMFQTALGDRCVLRIDGSDRIGFLQNLLTQNVENLPVGACVAAALLTPQGKLTTDMLLFHETEAVFVDCHAGQADALSKKLSLYKLRADVAITNTDLQVHAIWQEDGFPCPPTDGFVEDPRHEGLGLRGLFTAAPDISLPARPLIDWHGNRIRLGIAEGPDDMPPGTVFPLEFGLHLANMVDFAKGCFVGQEVTSRTHRKGTLRKKLHHVRLQDGSGIASAGDPVMRDERPVGTLVSVLGDEGLALIREDAAGETLHVKDALVIIGGGLFGRAPEA